MRFKILFDEYYYRYKHYGQYRELFKIPVVYSHCFILAPVLLSLGVDLTHIWKISPQIPIYHGILTSVLGILLIICGILCFLFPHANDELTEGYVILMSRPSKKKLQEIETKKTIPSWKNEFSKSNGVSKMGEYE